MLPDFGTTIVLLLAAVALFGIWQATRPKWTMVVVVSPEGVQSHRGLPTAQEQKILAFFREELTPDARVTIRALRRPNGYLKIAFAGPLDPALRQRVRNFLITVL